MEASDEAKQKVEKEARELQTAEQDRLASEAAAAAAAAAAEPQEENKIQAQCGGCKRNFEFPVPQSNIEGFEFTCTNCGSHNRVEL